MWILHILWVDRMEERILFVNFMEENGLGLFISRMVIRTFLRLKRSF